MEKYSFSVLDPGKKCKDCGSFLKINLTMKNPTANRCYKCHERKKRNEKKYKAL